MPSPVNHRVLGAAAATTLAGVPLAAAAVLRLKYGPTVFHDLVDIRKQMALMRTLEDNKRNNVQLADFFEEHARNNPEKALILYKDEVHTYGDLDKAANKLARFVQSSAVVSSRDTVAIFMLNEPNFVICWLAFVKLGLKVAFLNFNLRGDPLLHCIKVCNVKAIACGRDGNLLDALGSIMPDLEALGVTVWVPGDSEVQDKAIPRGIGTVDTRNENSDPMPRSLRQGSSNNDVTMYIFTSGTTGLPKPAKITHNRVVRSSYTHRADIALTKDDVVYTALPLYHSSAFIIFFSGIVRVGGSVVLSNFSVRRFWDDVRRYRATIIPYIGEMCRYLLAQPPRLDDGKYSHEIRYALGNGLAADIWIQFQKRFNIKRIIEFYGSTEGTFAIVNADGRVGSVGRYPPLIGALTDVIVIVQCDPETAQPLRGPDGRCLPTPSGETGLLLFRLTDRMKFDGYLGDRSMNEKKLVRNVKKAGDVFFNTGDLMMMDKDGYLYFKDRLGDTFRWKGENVATTEVACALNEFPGIQDTNVYGVRVPGHDGKAGMAAILPTKDKKLDLKGFYDHVVKELPLYACPKFLRIMPEMDVTGTFKHKKTDLAREGFDPNVVSDPLFFMDMRKKTYSPLDNITMQRIVVGQAKL